MCANYKPVTAQDRLVQYFGVDRPEGQTPPEVYPGGLAPFIVRQHDRVELARDARLGLFGLLPVWAKDLAFGRRTYNARSETVAQKPAFREAWRHARRCIVPVEVVFEPNWESGRAVRYAISRRDGRPMGIAGLWGWWRDAKGQEWLSFTMLTINADGHAVFERMHRPGDEKRMVAILDEADYDTWLEATDDRAKALLVPFAADRLQAQPDPRPSIERAGAVAQRAKPKRARPPDVASDATKPHDASARGKCDDDKDVGPEQLGLL